MTNASAAFHALAEPMRTTIVEYLSRSPMAVGTLASRLPISRPAVSQHLRILKDAGLVRDRAEGTRRVYSIDPEGLGQIRQWLDRQWESALAAFAAAAEKEEKTR